MGWGVHRGADDGSTVQVQAPQVELYDRAGNRASDHPSAAFDEGRQQRCDQLATHDVDTSWGKLGHGG